MAKNMKRKGRHTRYMEDIKAGRVGGLPRALRRYTHHKGKRRYGGKPSYIRHGKQLGATTGIYFPIGGLDFEEILKYKNKYEGARNALIVGAGPSGRDWESHCDDDTIVFAANSSIAHLAERANYFICTEGNGYELPWYWTEGKFTRIVSYCSAKRVEDKKAISIERGWHVAGFNPREYINAKPFTGAKANSRTANPYYKYRTQIGWDKESGREWGLIKGPVCYPGNMSVGTVCLNTLHLLAFMGFNHTKIIGFELCQKAKVDHWTEPGFKYVPSRWSPPECFMTVNGNPTLWHFALSAAYIVSLAPVFAEAGFTWEDHSQGLMGIDGIETLMEKINSKPEDVEL